MKILNVHERTLARPPAEVGRLLDSLASDQDGLWPHEMWPPMKFDKPLQVGARGGHGPVRYVVRSYDPGRSVSFTFTGPKGFNGHHRFDVNETGVATTILRHVIDMDASGPAMLSWPLVFRPLHNALIENAFDKAAKGLGLTPTGPPWNPWVRLLRWVIRKARKKP
jgi:hypothetical protein